MFFAHAQRWQLVDDPPERRKGRRNGHGLLRAVSYISHYIPQLRSALILHHISYTSIGIAHVHCFVLMSSCLRSVNCLPQAWLLVGQAVRAAQDLGLHVRPSDPPARSEFLRVRKALSRTPDYTRYRERNPPKDIVGRLYTGSHARSRSRSPYWCRGCRL